MKPADRNLRLLSIAMLMLALLAAPAHAVTRALFAAGTPDQLWTADVTPSASPEAPQAVITTIRLRTPGDQLRWHEVGELAEAPFSLGTRGSELLIVLADGEWKIARAGDIRSGVPLPNNARAMALAGAGDDIWAIGGLDPTRPATTQGATTATTSRALAQAPSPSRKPRPLALFLLRRGAWQLVGEVPVDFKHEQVAAISLAVLDGTLTLAIVGPARGVQLYTRAGDKWSDMRDVETLDEGARMKLLEVQGRPALWIAERDSAGRLYYASEGWQSPVKFAEAAKLQAFDRRALAYALGQLRLLATDGKGRIAEQLYNPDGTLLGEAVEARTTSSALEKRIASIIQFIIMAALLAWMLGSLRQRPNLAEVIARIDQLHVAPVSLRFAGGLIDALPLIAGVVASALFASRRAAGAAAQLDLASPEVATLASGVGLYFLHVTLLEILTGRSLGKWITGTRVANLDGSTPYISQILARNALRLIDVILLGVPLLAILQSPLRQRVGDMMGGTTVVMNTAPPMELKSSDEASSDQPPPPSSPDA